MVDGRFLVFTFLNDNHLSNVKTLQSIYRQNYPNIFLIACNDCTDAFQSERYLYNLENGRGTNIQGVYLHENKYPQGECQSLKNLWEISEAEYMITLHSGEYFVSEDVLDKCVQIMSESEKTDGIVMNTELWSNDLKKLILKNNVFMKNEKTNAEKGYYNSMLAYRTRKASEFLKLFSEKDYLDGRVVIELIREGSNNISIQDFSSCKYSVASIKNEEGIIPKLCDSYRLKSIYNKLKSMKKK